jgi:hypothetical protein
MVKSCLSLPGTRVKVWPPSIPMAEDWDSICLSGQIEEITTDSTVRFGCTSCHMSPSREVWAMSAIALRRSREGEWVWSLSGTTPGPKKYAKASTNIIHSSRRGTYSWFHHCNYWESGAPEALPVLPRVGRQQIKQTNQTNLTTKSNNQI